MDVTNLPEQPGQPVAIPAIPGVLIQITKTADGGYSLHVQNGPNRVPELCRTSTNGHLLLGSARSLAEGLKAGISLHQFVGDALSFHITADAQPTLDAALAEHCADLRTVRADQAIEALRSLKDDPESAEELAARIRADLEAVEAHLIAERNALAADVARIMSDGDGQRFRSDTRRAVVEEARRQAAEPPVMQSSAALAVLAEANRTIEAFAAREHVNTRPKFHGAEAELSPAQRRALRVADGFGQIWAAPGVTKATLESLAKKGYGVCEYGTHGARPHEVVKLILNQTGRDTAGELGRGEAA